jgi:hypothetical protein
MNDPPNDGEGDLGKAIHLDCSCRLRLKVDHTSGFVCAIIVHDHNAFAGAFVRQANLGAGG